MEDKAVRCKVCKRLPKDISEYQERVQTGEFETEEQAVVRDEGTYNPITKQFYCTTCYVKVGMPLGLA